MIERLNHRTGKLTTAHADEMPTPESIADAYRIAGMEEEIARLKMELEYAKATATDMGNQLNMLRALLKAAAQNHMQFAGVLNGRGT